MQKIKIRVFNRKKYKVVMNINSLVFNLKITSLLYRLGIIVYKDDGTKVNKPTYIKK